MYNNKDLSIMCTTHTRLRPSTAKKVNVPVQKKLEESSSYTSQPSTSAIARTRPQIRRARMRHHLAKLPLASHFILKRHAEETRERRAALVALEEEGSPSARVD